jgi:energy-coupling factor transporter transmembrane protein EcfT
MRLRLAEGGTLRHWRALSAVFAAALTRSALRSQKVSTAMMSRGFDGVFPVTVSLRWKFRDTALLVASVVLAAFIFAGGR